MLNLQANQQEVYPPHNHIFQVVLGLGILEFNMQAVLNAHVHLDGAVGFRRDAVRVDPNVLFSNHVGHAPRHRDSHKIAEFDVDAVVGLVLLLDVFEIEVKGLRMLKVARGS